MARRTAPDATRCAPRFSAPAVRTAAIALRDLLEELTLPSWIKTTGSKGFHIVVPIDGKTPIGEVAQFANVVGRVLVDRDPKHLTLEFSKVDRSGRIYGATFAAAYTVRARAGAPVSAPCTWDEIERGDVDPKTFSLRTMRSRVSKVGDLWAGLLTGGKSLKKASTKLRKLADRK